MRRGASRRRISGTGRPSYSPSATTPASRCVVFKPPIGYRCEKVSGHGKLLVRDEPLASIVRDILEGYAAGRLETQSEIQRYLERQPEWPKDRRGRELEAQKALLNGRIASCGQPRASFAETCRTACAFLANPWELWISRSLEDRRAVLRLAFGDRLSYARSEGYRTAKISLLLRR